MNLLRFALVIIPIYSGIVYLVDIKIGLYAGIMALVFLIVILPIITPVEKKMSDLEMERFGRNIINWKEDANWKI